MQTQTKQVAPGTAQHTPGPWHISPGEPGQYHRIKDQSGPIAHVLPIGDKLEAYANARLIAAAPELLAELEQTRAALLYLVQEVEARKGCPKEIIGGAKYHAEQARAAIAKATGGAL